MKPGQGSRTAELVCMGRAIASGRSPFPSFVDPTAMVLLSNEARARAEAVRSGERPRGIRLAFAHEFLRRQAVSMVARTVEIDAFVRSAASPQVVILGAGLDGRAWRMPELADAIVFEVDHPDTQRDKQARLRSLDLRAREVRFVSVDFTRDDLDERLAAAGHDPKARTTWIWEGVVMYLDRRAIEATLAILSGRSAPGSRLMVLYHAPSFVVRLARPVLAWIGEPFKSSFQPPAMRAMLAEYAFEVSRDESLPEIGARMSERMARGTAGLPHLRFASATRT